MSAKPRLLSGIKPTGAPHIGNYFGAIQQWVGFQDEYDCYLFIADLHGLNQIYNPEELRSNIVEITKTYLACGLDPERVTIFQQSALSAHAELAWMFNCITSMGQLERAHAYKDALAKKKPINVGLFDYPVLMAADILLYKPALVPVGSDQQQHIEITNDIAQRFNHLFGETFPLPEAMVLKDTAIVPGLDGRKMSKSYNNIIGIFDSAEVLKKKVMSIVTDSKAPDEPKDPDTCTVFAYHRLVSRSQLGELEQRYRKGTISYKESKELLLASLLSFLAPIQAKKAELDSNPQAVLNVLKAGNEKAALIANQTLQEVKEKTGLLL